MENQEDLVTPLFEKVKEYGETRYALMKLKTVDKTVQVFSGVVTRIIFILVFSMFLIFLSVALAIWLGQTCGEMYLGFTCVGLMYAFFGILLVLFFRKGLKKRIADGMVKNMLN
jgi:Putative Actinobacterial Holin-X, holin superfamily III